MEKGRRFCILFPPILPGISGLASHPPLSSSLHICVCVCVRKSLGQHSLFSPVQHADAFFFFFSLSIYPEKGRERLAGTICAFRSYPKRRPEESERRPHREKGGDY